MIQHLGVIGAGTIGRGLALRAAARGLDVVLVEDDPTARAQAPDTLARELRAARLAGWVAPQAPSRAILARIAVTDDLTALAGAAAVVECVTERLEAKRALLRALEAACPAAALVATSTSALPLAALSEGLARPERLLATHWMNPVLARGALELAGGERASAEALALARALAARLGLEAVEVTDGAGFVINRALMLAINEAIGALDEGRGDAATIDRAFTACLGHPLGPLATADLIGLDVVLDTLQALCEHADPLRYQPHPRLTRMVQAGHLGRKRGRGFFSDHGHEPG
jgi:3-hydroxybutyryl-CoA dehydrogenase